MRNEATILHVDLDAFFASVEQRDKPSLRGKPVVVGGVGGRGVVATASYEARVFGVHSAMPTREARRRCPNAAFLTGRFHAYQAASAAVMELLRSVSPLVEPLSMDEAFVDLAVADLGRTDLDSSNLGSSSPAGVYPDLADLAAVTALGRRLKEQVAEVTGGLTGSVGIASSKLLAKIASDLDKPDGLVVVPPGTELDLLRPMQVTVIPGVGPATTERLRRIGVHTVEDLLGISQDELVRVVGQSHGRGLYRLARADDDRAVVSEREVKSVSVEDTYETDHVDKRLLEALVERQSGKVSERLRKARLSGRTITVKIRLHDFSTHTRSATLPSPTDDPRVIARLSRTLLGEVDTSGGVRLLGVGVSGLADWIQEDLFADEDQATASPEVMAPGPAGLSGPRTTWAPGMDVVHAEHGPGWVWGSGKDVVTVRFETALTGPGRVASFSVNDPLLTSLHQPRS